MYVKEILLRKGRGIKTMPPSELLEFAAAHMKLEGVGALIVCDDNRKLKGILSERDIVCAMVDYGPRALQMSAAEFMNAHPPTCAPEDTIASAAKSMTQNRVRQLPVIENGAIIGIISIGDIVKERFEEMELERDTLRDLALSHQLVS